MDSQHTDAIETLIETLGKKSISVEEIMCYLVDEYHSEAVTVAHEYDWHDCTCCEMVDPYDYCGECDKLVTIATSVDKINKDIIYDLERSVGDSQIIQQQIIDDLKKEIDNIDDELEG